MIRLLLLGLFALLLMGADGGCREAPELDWVALQPPGSPQNVTGYCRPNTHAVFVVKNQGRNQAPASNAIVEFESGATVTVDVPTLAPGATSPILEAAIPAGCFQADCSFTIRVNSGNLPESITTNNSRAGRCIG